LPAAASQTDYRNRVPALDIETFANTCEASQACLQREFARGVRDTKLLGMTA
jgi:hypothetical protein